MRLAVGMCVLDGGFGNVAEDKKRINPLDRDWRGTTQPQSPISRWVARLLYSSCLVVLVGVLCWITIPPILHDKEFWLAPWIFSGYPNGVLPPISGQEANEEAIRAVCSERRTVSLAERDDRKNIENIAATLGQQRLGPSDTLLVYLSVHGISSGGQAYVLCSDYSTVGGLEEAYPLKDLLGQISLLDVATKVVVVDPGRLSCDPRLGILVNEFSRLVPEELEAQQDGDLWLLTASGAYEQPYTGSSDAQRHLARQIADGLRGAADKNRDGTIMLGELFEWVDAEFDKVGASKYVHLLCGATAEPDEVFVCQPSRLGSRPPSDAETSDAVAEEEPPDTTEQDPDRDDKLEGEKPAGDGGKNEPGEKAAPKTVEGETPGEGETESTTPQESDRQEAREAQLAALRAVWEAHALATERSDTPGDDTLKWSPIDIEPHLWRECEQRLLSSEQRCLAATSHSSPIEELDSLRAEIETFCRNLPAAKSNDDLGLVALRQQKNDLVYHARDYLRWHAIVSRYSRSDDTRLAFGSILKLLRGLLSVLDNFDSLEAECQGGKYERVEQTADKIRVELRSLRETEGRITKRLKLDPLQPLNRWEIEAVLSTTRVACEDRMNLLKKLDELETVVVSPLTVKQMWQTAQDQARLELEFIKLGGANGILQACKQGQENRDFEALLDDVDPKTKTDTAGYWPVYRELGERLKCFYERLPGRITDAYAAGSSSTEPVKVREAERLLRILDPRDSGDVDRSVVRKITIRPIKPPERVISTFAIEKPEPVKLKSDGTTKVVVAIRCKNLESTKGTASIEVDPPGTLAVRYEGDLVGPSDNLPLDLSGDRVTLTLSVKPTSLQLEKVELKASVRSGDRRDTKVFVLNPDWVNLIVETHEEKILGADPDDNNDQRFSIRTFPNRETPFYLSLENRSQEPRTVSVQIVSFPDKEDPIQLRPSLCQKIDRLDFVEPSINVQGKPFRLIGAPSPVELAPRDAANPGEPRVLEPFEAPPPEPESSDAPATPTPDEADQPTGLPASRHLAVVIRDKDSNEVWLNWLEIDPYEPREFVNYNVLLVDESRIEAHFMLPKDGPLPPKIADEPLVVTWKAYFGHEPALRTVVASCELTERGKDQVLEADVLDPKKQVLFHFQVGDYPRAFLTMYRDGDCREQRRSLGKIRILSPPNGDVFRKPLAEDSRLGGSKLVYADVAVDAPGLMPDKNAEVRMFVESLESRANLERDPDWIFVEDRQVDIKLELGAAGKLGILAGIGDFHVPLEKLDSFGEGKVRIRAELVLPGGDQTDDSRRDQVEILLDETAPKLATSEGTVSWNPSSGDPLILTATAADEGSGILKVVFGIDTSSDNRVDAEEFLPPLGRAEDDRYRFNVPEDTRPARPGRYRVEVVASDVVGNETRRAFFLRVQEGSMPTEKEKKPTTGTIRGTVISNSGRPASGITVQLDGTAHQMKTGSDGAFEFPDVPLGGYKLKAEGSIRNSSVSSDDVEVELSEENNEVEKTIRVK